MLQRIRQLLLPALLLGAALTPSLPASTQSELNSRWQGAWALTTVETASDCSGRYTDNEVRARGVGSKGDHRFAAGELATVYKIDLNRKRIDVLINLAEPLRVARREGPFTLYDALDCRVELQIDLARGASSKSVDDLDRLIRGVLEPYEDAASATSSPAWNGRLIEPLPEDYDETLAEYERWRVDQINAEIAARIEDSVEEAAGLVDRLERDEDFLAGFAAGVDRARSKNLGRDCDRLLSMSVSSFVENKPKRDGRDYRDGYQDGQELVFFLELARRLPRCFLQPPLF